MEVSVEVSRIINEIDAQIAKLQQARALLAGTVTERKGPGRPKGSKSAAVTTGGKRKLSAAGRKRISEAMKKRWAARRKETAK